MEGVNGLHHITAIAGPAQENLDFYAGVLGMRLVKKSVNQDDPGTYHLFYADADGHPGTDLTFFPVGAARAAAPGPRAEQRGVAGRAAGTPGVLGTAARELRRDALPDRDALRRARAAARRSARPARRAGRERVRACAGRSRRGTAARFPSPIRSAGSRRAAWWSASWRRRRVPDERARLLAAA